jgi:hypothetical protein
VAPHTVYACSSSQSLRFLISGANLGYEDKKDNQDEKEIKMKPGRVLLDTVEGTATLLEENDLLAPIMVADFPDFHLSQLTSESKIPLTVATIWGLDSQDVVVFPCKRDISPTPQPPQPSPRQ